VFSLTQINESEEQFELRLLGSPVRNDLLVTGAENIIDNWWQSLNQEVLVLLVR